MCRYGCCKEDTNDLDRPATAEEIAGFVDWVKDHLAADATKVEPVPEEITEETIWSAAEDMADTFREGDATGRDADRTLFFSPWVLDRFPGMFVDVVRWWDSKGRRWRLRDMPTEHLENLSLWLDREYPERRQTIGVMMVAYELMRRNLEECVAIEPRFVLGAIDHWRSTRR